MNKGHWYDYFWLWEIVYFSLGIFSIGFAWLGLFDFFLPLLFAIFGGNKFFCNRLCGRGQLYRLIGKRLKLTAHECVPSFLANNVFRRSFLIFFLLMFSLLLKSTWDVFTGAESLKQAIVLFWTFEIPWNFAFAGGWEDWFYRFAFGFYGLMLTSLLLGFIMMIFFKPRAWCAVCPMGTMTQEICKLKATGK